MPVIHHPVLKRAMTVSEQAAEILCTVPKSPWERGPLPRTRPTAITDQPSPEGDTTPSPEED